MDDYFRSHGDNETSWNAKVPVFCFCSVRDLHKGQACMTMIVPHLKSSQASSINTRNFLRLKPSSIQFTRHAQSTPINTIIMFVPQQEAWVVERMGKFNRILQPGLNFLIPIVDRVKYVQSLKELAIDIPKQSAITLDNVTLNIDGVLYSRVMDPYKASYGVEDPEFAITQLAQTTMRSELGKMSLDSIFRERESLNYAIVEAINKASNAWGIDCLRYEINDIKMSQKITDAIEVQVEAERKKRAAILEAEGAKEANIIIAQGRKQSYILEAEAKSAAKIIATKAEVHSVILSSIGHIFTAQLVLDATINKIIVLYKDFTVHLTKSAAGAESRERPPIPDNLSYNKAETQEESNGSEHEGSIIFNLATGHFTQEDFVSRKANLNEEKWVEYISDEDERLKSTSIQSESQETDEFHSKEPKDI